MNFWGIFKGHSSKDGKEIFWRIPKKKHKIAEMVAEKFQKQPPEKFLRKLRIPWRFSREIREEIVERISHEIARTCSREVLIENTKETVKWNAGKNT